MRRLLATDALDALLGFIRDYRSSTFKWVSNSPALRRARAYNCSVRQVVSASRSVSTSSGNTSTASPHSWTTAWVYQSINRRAARALHKGRSLTRWMTAIIAYYTPYRFAWCEDLMTVSLTCQTHPLIRQRSGRLARRARSWGRSEAQASGALHSSRNPVPCHGEGQIFALAGYGMHAGIYRRFGRSWV